jgi:hypothetical protein
MLILLLLYNLYHITLEGKYILDIDQPYQNWCGSRRGYKDNLRLADGYMNE